MGACNSSDFIYTSKFALISGPGSKSSTAPASSGRLSVGSHTSHRRGSAGTKSRSKATSRTISSIGYVENSRGDPVTDALSDPDLTQLTSADIEQIRTLSAMKQQLHEGSDGSTGASSVSCPDPTDCRQLSNLLPDIKIVGQDSPGSGSGGTPNSDGKLFAVKHSVPAGPRANVEDSKDVDVRASWLNGSDMDGSDRVIHAVNAFQASDSPNRPMAKKGINTSKAMDAMASSKVADSLVPDRKLANKSPENNVIQPMSKPQNQWSDFSSSSLLAKPESDTEDPEGEDDPDKDRGSAENQDWLRVASVSRSRQGPEVQSVQQANSRASPISGIQSSQASGSKIKDLFPTVDPDVSPLSGRKQSGVRQNVKKFGELEVSGSDTELSRGVESDESDSKNPFRENASSNAAYLTESNLQEGSSRKETDLSKKDSRSSLKFERGATVTARDSDLLMDGPSNGIESAGVGDLYSKNGSSRSSLNGSANGSFGVHEHEDTLNQSGSSTHRVLPKDADSSSLHKSSSFPRLDLGKSPPLQPELSSAMATSGDVELAREAVIGDNSNSGSDVIRVLSDVAVSNRSSEPMDCVHEDQDGEEDQEFCASADAQIRGNSLCIIDGWSSEFVSSLESQDNEESQRDRHPSEDNFLSSTTGR